MPINYKWAAEDHSIVSYTMDDGTYVSISADLANTDYQAFLAWCEEGNTPEPYVAPEPLAPPTPKEKLAASGLTVEDLKGLLGLP